MSTEYPSDFTDGQWKVLRRLLPPRRATGRPLVDRRTVLNAILDVVRTGCQWRQSPTQFPGWKTVYTVGVLFLSAARRTSSLKATAGIVESQSAKTAEGGSQRGHDEWAGFAVVGGES